MNDAGRAKLHAACRCILGGVTFAALVGNAVVITHILPELSRSCSEHVRQISASPNGQHVLLAGTMDCKLGGTRTTFARTLKVHTKTVADESEKPQDFIVIEGHHRLNAHWTGGQQIVVDLPKRRSRVTQQLTASQSIHISYQ